MKKIIEKIFKKRSKPQVELTPAEAKIREKIEDEFYLKTVWAVLGTAFFILFLYIIVFFINVEGKEDTKVPNLVGLSLSESVIKLQERALYPKLSRKNSSPKEKGLIMSQGISAGSVVKAGRIVPITVSLGGVIDSVGSYEGQTIEAVQAELHKLFAGSTTEPILVIGESVGILSDEPIGTIISQDPPPGSVISDVTEIVFHVSRGKERSTYVVPTMIGLNFKDGLAKISQWSVRYQFSVRDKRGNEKPGMIISQVPSSGTTTPWSTVVDMVMTTPEDYPSEFAFGVLEIVVPSYPISIPMTLERITLDGITEVIFTKRTFGGALTIPYLEEVGTTLSVTINGEVFKTVTVRQN